MDANVACFGGAFTALTFPQLRTFRQCGGVRMVCDRILSLSVVASLPPGERDEIERRVADVVRMHADTKDLNAQVLHMQRHVSD